MKKLSVTETINAACRARPALAPFLQAFESLFLQRPATAALIAIDLRENGLDLPAEPGDRPILLENLPAGLGEHVAGAATDFLPLLREQKSIAPYYEPLRFLFLAPENDPDREELIRAMLAKTPVPLLRLATKFNLPANVLEFASEFIISTVLRALASHWKKDSFERWNKGVCPVCGLAPVIAWLDRRPPVGVNDFLAEGGGKKYLHCGMCGTDWHFTRGICPKCGTQGQDAMQILGEEDRRQERIDWCANCHSYLPQVDLREMADRPDMDAQALCLMHLDIVAAEKDLLPLKPSFWNMF